MHSWADANITASSPTASSPTPPQLLADAIAEAQQLEEENERLKGG